MAVNNNKGTSAGIWGQAIGTVVNADPLTQGWSKNFLVRMR